MKPEDVITLVDAARLIGKPVHYYPNFGKFLGSAAAGIFLSYFMYWEGKQEDEDGWIYKRTADITKETALGRYEIEQARKRLRGMQILEEKLAGVPAQLYYRFDWTVFGDLYQVWSRTQAEPRKKKPKTPPPNEEKPKPIIHRMQEIFNKFHILKYPVGYEWSPQDWGNLKDLETRVKGRLLDKKIKESEGNKDAVLLAIVDDEVCYSFEMILENLPDFHKNRNFTPGKILSNFNVIIQDIQNEFRKPDIENKNDKRQSATW